MPLSDHYMFKQAGVEKSLLWRYMSLAKFLAFVESTSVFFSSLEDMTKVDPFEGTIPASYMEYRKWKSESDIPKRAMAKFEEHVRAKNGDRKTAFDSFILSRENWLQTCYANRRASYISCWHANMYESEAMWKLYDSSGEGVAIVTTLDRINTGLDTSKHLVRGGLLNYVDFDKVHVNESRPNMYEPAMLKRISFSHEREFRLVYIDSEINLLACRPHTAREAFRQPYRPGYNVPIDIEKFVEKVVIAPTAQKWLQNIIETYCSRYKIKVEASSLLSAPVCYEPIA